jgi:hypothetical protein
MDTQMEPAIESTSVSMIDMTINIDYALIGLIVSL